MGFVQEFVPEIAVERLDEGVLRRRIAITAEGPPHSARSKMHTTF